MRLVEEVSSTAVTPYLTVVERPVLGEHISSGFRVPISATGTVDWAGRKQIELPTSWGGTTPLHGVDTGPSPKPSHVRPGGWSVG